jgi:hypothetical protein
MTLKDICNLHRGSAPISRFVRQAYRVSYAHWTEYISGARDIPYRVLVAIQDTHLQSPHRCLPITLVFNFNGRKAYHLIGSIPLS